VDDALNIRMHSTSIIMYQLDLEDKILEAAKLDQKYMEVKEKRQQGNLKCNFEDYKLKRMKSTCIGVKFMC
jgi:hypothetical protein